MITKSIFMEMLIIEFVLTFGEVVAQDSIVSDNITETSSATNTVITNNNITITSTTSDSSTQQSITKSTTKTTQVPDKVFPYWVPFIKVVIILTIGVFAGLFCCPSKRVSSTETTEKVSRKSQTKSPVNSLEQDSDSEKSTGSEPYPLTPRTEHRDSYDLDFNFINKSNISQEIAPKKSESLKNINSNKIESESEENKQMGKTSDSASDRQSTGRSGISSKSPNGKASNESDSQMKQ
jgi:hypothetical protein